MIEPVPPPPRAPRQRRAVATRQRVYEAAMAEYGRGGLEGARVEDIVTAAGVSWGTFFHYFPTKEDVLLEASATVCRAFATAAAAGLETGQDTEMVLRQAFEALFLHLLELRADLDQMQHDCGVEVLDGLDGPQGVGHQRPASGSEFDNAHVFRRAHLLPNRGHP